MPKRPPNKRHMIRLKRVGKGRKSLGQKDPSTDTVIAEDVPASIEALRGRELEIARQMYAQATVRVRCYNGPDWNITAEDYIERQPGGERLNIGYVGDPDVNEIGLELELLCGEYA